MRNQSFNHSSISRCLIASDFYKDNELAKDEYRERLVTRALEIANNGFENHPPLNIKKNKKTIYATAALPERLVLRRCTQNIKSSLNIKIKARGQTAEEIRSYLREGTEYIIFRLDIESFFESLNYLDLCKTIQEIDQLSTQTKNLIIDYLKNFNTHWGQGIPRGIEISPIIAELALEKFDWAIKSHPETLYYTRFVDDILVITTAKHSEGFFINWAEQKLPRGLRFSKRKTKFKKIPKRKKAGAANLPEGREIWSFDFLGYSYKIIDSPLPIDAKTNKENDGSAKAVYRSIKTDIASEKIKKIKTKVAKAIYNYRKNRDIQLLLDRIAFLTSNRDLIVKDKSRKIPTGIYYNYSKIDHNAPSLAELDKYLINLITGKRGRLHSGYTPLFSNHEKSLLAKYKFELGFKGRNHKKFSPDRLKEITRIWE
ncbi:antiviral reverse transcriptase Drt3a [Pseudomonas knackmussii]|uniref:antiviral reverse transcriptase Drt3a n=1 Tax=Pseudomonas knackmussii TaxID=65741 RepID=UPI003BDFBBE1